MTSRVLDITNVPINTLHDGVFITEIIYRAARNVSLQMTLKGMPYSEQYTMKPKVLELVGALGLLARSVIAAPQFDPNSVYAGKNEQSAAQPSTSTQNGEKGIVTVLRLNSYAHLREFTVPEGIQKASV